MIPSPPPRSHYPLPPRDQPLTFQSVAEDGSMLEGWDVSTGGGHTDTATRNGLRAAAELTKYLMTNPSRAQEGNLDAAWGSPAFHLESRRPSRLGFLAGITIALTHRSPRAGFGAELVTLPFLKRASGVFWHMGPRHSAGDFAEQTKRGSRYAQQFVRYLREDPRAPVEAAMERIVSAETFTDATWRGVRWGFSLGLSQALAAARQPRRDS